MGEAGGVRGGMKSVFCWVHWLRCFRCAGESGMLRRGRGGGADRTGKDVGRGRGCGGDESGSMRRVFVDSKRPVLEEGFS